MTNNTLSLRIFQGVKMKTKFKCACGTTTRYTDKDAKKITNTAAKSSSSGRIKAVKFTKMK